MEYLSRGLSFRFSHIVSRARVISREVLFSLSLMRNSHAFFPAQNLKSALLNVYASRETETEKERERTRVKEKRKYCFAVVVYVVISLSLSLFNSKTKRAFSRVETKVQVDACSRLRAGKREREISVFSKRTVVSFSCEERRRRRARRRERLFSRVGVSTGYFIVRPSQREREREREIREREE